MYGFVGNSTPASFDPLGDRVCPSPFPAICPGRPTRFPANSPWWLGTPGATGPGPRGTGPIRFEAPKPPPSPQRVSAPRVPPPRIPPAEPPKPPSGYGSPQCILTAGFSPPPGKDCWECVYLCSGGTFGSPYSVTRMQPGGCVRQVLGYVPGWLPTDAGREACESAPCDEGTMPFEGLYPIDLGK